MSMFVANPASARTYQGATTFWVPIGFNIAPIHGYGSSSISSTTKVSASAANVKGDIEKSISFSMGQINDGEVVVKLRLYRIEYYKCDDAWDCFWNPSYGQITVYNTYASIILRSSGTTSHTYIPNSVSYNGYSSASWNVRYSSSDFNNDLRQSGSEEYIVTSTTTVTLDASIDLYGVKFGFSTSFTSSASNTYGMDGGYLHYGDFKGGTIYSWSYYVPPPPPPPPCTLHCPIII